MNMTRIAAAVLASMTMALASTATLAQDRDHRGGPPDRRDGPQAGPDRGGPGPGRAMQARDNRNDRNDRNDRDHRGGDRGDRDRGAGPNHDFRRGGRLPTEYRSRQYVVDDWRGHHLQAPPRGYHWVQAGPDYVLAAIATGVIAQIFLGN